MLKYLTILNGYQSFVEEVYRKSGYKAKGRKVTQAFGRDLELYQKLYSINPELSKLPERVNHTLMQVGGEAHLAVNQLAKTAKWARRAWMA